ncbi:glycosyltransferase family 2 protein [Candidatus Soleaferrea massiliensis]|uniref:glycosyltransferase family 2 protein n=1 Tax=Candidatus Soleaferrea massiliensis TaxID=1470354 RepID=UPI00058ADB5E|nr:glycosyltransferase family 2 protein [Candidatus Soleaferrea massiliensis]
MKKLVIIPAYNESMSIKRVVENLREKAADYDYIIVNDCSTDQTEMVLKENGYHYISFPSNLGIGGAVQAGYKYAKQHSYDIAIQMDGDGQHDPQYLKDIVEPVKHGMCDMAIGSRFINKTGFQSSLIRRLGIKFISFVIRLCCGEKVFDTTSGFRACNAQLIHYFSDNYAQDYPEPDAIVSASLNGWKIQEVPIVMCERSEGVSSINTWKSVYYMIKVPLSLILHRISTGRKKVKK